MRLHGYTVLTLLCIPSLSLVGCGSACAGSAPGSWDAAFFCRSGGGGGGEPDPEAPPDPRILLLVEGAMLEGSLPETGAFVLPATAEATVGVNHEFHSPELGLHDDPSVSVVAESGETALRLDLNLTGTSFGALPEGTYASGAPEIGSLEAWFGENSGTGWVGGEAVDVQLEIEGAPGGRRTVSVWAFVHFQETPMHAVFDVTEVE